MTDAPKKSPERPELAKKLSEQVYERMLAAIAAGKAVRSYSRTRYRTALRAVRPVSHENGQKVRPAVIGSDRSEGPKTGKPGIARNQTACSHDVPKSGSVL